jgi:two-component system NtrC family sensor kinase
MPSPSHLLASLLPSGPCGIAAPLAAERDSISLLITIVSLGALASLIVYLSLWRKQLAQRRSELDALSRIAELAVCAQDEAIVLREAMRLFVQTTHCLYGSIYLMQNSSDPVLALRYPEPRNPGEFQFVPTLVQRVSERLDVQFEKPTGSLRAEQIVGIPLSAGGRILGALCATIPSSYFFLSPRADWLKTFGASVGMAVENTRLYLTAQQDLARLVAVQELHRGISSALDPGRLEELMLGKICGFLDIDAADLYLKDGATNQLKLSASRWPKELEATNISQARREELAQRTVRAGRVLIGPSSQFNLPSDLFPLVSYVGVPLIVQEQPFGALSLYSRRALDYDEEEINFLSTVGGLAAVAIDNAHLVQAARDAESEAKKQALYLERVMESLAEGVLVFGRDGRVSEVNRSLCEMTGYSRQELLGMDSAFPFCPFEEIGHCHDLIVSCQNGAVIGPLELLLQHKNGRRFPVQVAMSPFETDRDTINGCVVSVRDISADQEKLAELMQTSKLASIGRLAAGVAHELNNPLTAILGNAQYIRDSLRDPEASQQLKIIEAQAQRAARIVRSLLSFARNRPQARSLTDLNDTIRNTVELINYQLHADGISLTQELDPALPWIEADSSQLQQVILNILVNAHQAIKSCCGYGAIKIATAANDKVVRFSCTDDGPGIATQILKDLFKPFVTTKGDGEGTGLGLSICYQIISEHDGRIWVETEPGKGSTFFFELPRPGVV